MNKNKEDLSHWIGKRVKSTYSSSLKNKIGTVYCILLGNQVGIKWNDWNSGHNGFSSDKVLYGEMIEKGGRKNDCWYCPITTCTIVDSVPEIINNYELY